MNWLTVLAASLFSFVLAWFVLARSEEKGWSPKKIISVFVMAVLLGFTISGGQALWEMLQYHVLFKG
ncbi:hypothetical protein [Effusibacillus lacus]|uniref:hypothetical protein n=1 Tax=Effusibacillus lacus TaxID=1348429 RepID=UPI000BB82502|nr:hypothetical protein [Effusibacillus lacus]TCS76130.1 hypothetical protein EDD64_104102 [Effusibacillus lacus]